MEPKKLYRDRTNRVICGVCAGVADYFKIDVTIVRILWVAATLCWSIGFWAYLIAAIVLPDRPEAPPQGPQDFGGQTPPQQ